MIAIRRAAGLLVLVAACGSKEPPSQSPRAATAPSVEQAKDAGATTPRRTSFRVQDLIGEKLSALDRAPCVDASGWQLARGIYVDQRALAVRTCARFRGPHDELEKGTEAASTLSVISDGGRIVFAVASKEYDLEQAKRIADALQDGLLLEGCQQVHSAVASAGFDACPGAAKWAATTRVGVRKEGGMVHAVVLEVATDRAIAGRIAAAYASEQGP